MLREQRKSLTHPPQYCSLPDGSEQLLCSEGLTHPSSIVRFDVEMEHHTSHHYQKNVPYCH